MTREPSAAPPDMPEFRSIGLAFSSNTRSVPVTQLSSPTCYRRQKSNGESCSCLRKQDKLAYNLLPGDLTTLAERPYDEIS